MQGAQAADRPASDGRGSLDPEHLGRQIDVADIDQAPRLELIARISRLVGAQRDVAIDATLQIAPVRGWYQALRYGLEFEDIQRFSRRSRRVLRGERAG